MSSLRHGGLVMVLALAASAVQSDDTARYTKIANDGSALAESAALGAAPRDWACMRDTATGLTWEVKTRDGGLRDLASTYTPYDGNPATNGGDPGYRDKTSGRCLRERMEGASCNTEAYVNAVRASRLCGYDDWRLPTLQELMALARETSSARPGETRLALPNTAEGWYWTAITRVGVTSFSRVVLLPPQGRPAFYDGSYLVIAVRGGK
jgi:hypothetical protein